MSEQNNFLEIRFDGESVGPGKIPVSHLLHFLPNLFNVFYRVGLSLQGETEGLRRGRPPKSVSDELDMELVSLREGSPAAVLGFVRRTSQPALLGMDFGHEILRKTLDGLTEIQENGIDTPLPAGYDEGVLKAWHDAGRIFEKGVDQVSFSLDGKESLVEVSFNRTGASRIQERIRVPEVKVGYVEGRLLMADFKETRLYCRVHPSFGEPVTCEFDESKKKSVLENMLKFVRVVGHATESSTTGRITHIEIDEIECLEDARPIDIHSPEDGLIINQTFWDPPSLDELIEMQNVKPFNSIEYLYGTWPGEDDDGFEDLIRELRQRRSEDEDS